MKRSMWLVRNVQNRFEIFGKARYRVLWWCPWKILDFSRLLALTGGRFAHDRRNCGGVICLNQMAHFVFLKLDQVELKTAENEASFSRSIWSLYSPLFQENLGPLVEIQYYNRTTLNGGLSSDGVGITSSKKQEKWTNNSIWDEVLGKQRLQIPSVCPLTLLPTSRPHNPPLCIKRSLWAPDGVPNFCGHCTCNYVLNSLIFLLLGQNLGIWKVCMALKRDL